MPVFAADKDQALKAGKKMFPCDMNNYFASRVMAFQMRTSCRVVGRRIWPCFDPSPEANDRDAWSSRGREPD